MISDEGLNSLAIFLGCLAMLLIVLYHFLEVNAIDDDATTTGEKAAPKSPAAQKQGQQLQDKGHARVESKS